MVVFRRVGDRTADTLVSDLMSLQKSNFPLSNSQAGLIRHMIPAQSTYQSIFVLRYYLTTSEDLHPVPTRTSGVTSPYLHAGILHDKFKANDSMRRDDGLPRNTCGVTRRLSETVNFRTKIPEIRSLTASHSTLKLIFAAHTRLSSNTIYRLSDSGPHTNSRNMTSESTNTHARSQTARST